MSQTATARTFATISVLGLIIAVVATVFGHLGLGPGFDPLVLTLSDYALSDRGGAIEVAMVALAGGSLALLAGLAAARAPVRGLPTVLMLVWGVGLLIAAIIPTDPPGAASISLAGNVHRYASVAGFVSLPIAAAILAHRFGPTRPWASLSSLLRRLAAVCAAGVALLWYVAFPGGRLLMGLVERGLVAVEIVMLLALCLGLYRFGARVRHPAARPVAAEGSRARAVATTTRIQPFSPHPTLQPGRAASDTTRAGNVRSSCPGRSRSSASAAHLPHTRVRKQQVRSSCGEFGREVCRRGV